MNKEAHLNVSSILFIHCCNDSNLFLRRLRAYIVV